MIDNSRSKPVNFIFLSVHELEKQVQRIIVFLFITNFVSNNKTKILTVNTNFIRNYIKERKQKCNSCKSVIYIMIIIIWHNEKNIVIKFSF